MPYLKEHKSLYRALIQHAAAAEARGLPDEAREALIAADAAAASDPKLSKWVEAEVSSSLPRA